MTRKRIMTMIMRITIKMKGDMACRAVMKTMKMRTTVMETATDSGIMKGAMDRINGIMGRIKTGLVICTAQDKVSAA